MSRSPAPPGSLPTTSLGLLLVIAFAGAGAVDDAPRRALGARAPELPPLNLQVVEFAKRQIGRAVGRGECTELAASALDHAGARRFPWTASGDYVWGREVGSFREALPGDIVQFRDAVFEGRRPLSGGRWQTWRYEYPHHTAIISEVRRRGTEVVLLHQNVTAARSKPEARRLVQQGLIRPDSLQPGGRVWIYRPVAREPDDRGAEDRDGSDTTSAGLQVR